VKAYGYNIFVSGLPGTGKATFAAKLAEAAADSGDPPRDTCYVYNFTEPKYPKLLTLKNGSGEEFKQDMDELVTRLSVDVPALFNGYEFEVEKNAIVKKLHEKRDEAIAAVTKSAKENGFGVKSLTSGIQFLPIIDGEMVNEEQYETLSPETKAEITAKSETITEQTAAVLRTIKGYEAETAKKVEELEYKHGLFLTGRLMAGLFTKYADEYGVLDYLQSVKEDVMENLCDFLESGESDDELMQLMPWAAKKGRDESFMKYQVNLIACNNGRPPVVIGHNPTYANLVGEIEYESEHGNLTTDFTKIKAGLLHKANGGYLILRANDVLSNYSVWETLKKTLKTKEITIEPLREYGGSIAAATLKPEPIPLDVKIILIGSGLCHEILFEYDDDFQKLFKLHAEFDYEMPNDGGNNLKIAEFIKKYISDNKTAEFDNGAVARICEYAARLSENQQTLSSQFGKISELLTETAAWAKLDGAEVVAAEHVNKAVAERDRRLNMYEEKLQSLIDKNVIMIDTDGSKTAQINGLAVLESGGYAFAKPSRITATTYVGKSGIVNIEKEAEMSGSIHDKGVEVLTGYLGQLYAQDFPLSLSCRICFEQNYHGIDGDSASSAELYAILSSLADLPIKQNLAVTGSINQRGEIQPIGGVTLKIEGFFATCKKRGLTGEQGVIIPEQNTRDLALNDEVVEAVKDGVFHIYAITTADEGMELLTGTPSGSRKGRGKYPPDSVHGRVSRKLRDFYKKSIAE
jgi:lon-related putative ATP-dependent protease